MNNASVLCVEHRSEDLQAMKYMLEEAGYQVICATTGHQALLEVVRNPIQGVLLEYDLPDVSGGFVRDAMKELKPDLPVLLFSGVGGQTPFLLRFFDSYLRNAQHPEQTFLEMERDQCDS